MLRRLVLPLMLALLASLQAISSAEAQSEYCQIAASAVQEASALRGLKILRSIPCYVHDRKKVKDYLLQTISEKLPPDKLKTEELVYKAIGIIPDSFDYEHGLVDFYISQIGGYYDPGKKHFVMAGWMPVILQTTVAVHELTHGLQDQHFNLEKLIDAKLDNSDALIARSALVEGDATCVMLDYMRKLTGQPPLQREKSVESFMLQTVLSASMMGPKGGAPESLKLILIFPYTSGVRFAHDLLTKGGYQAVDKAFEKIPRSTEEILHLEKYSQSEPDFIIFSPADLRPADLPASARPLYEDTIGEFAISALLGMFEKDRNKATQAAAGWGGDRVVVFKDEVSGKRSIVWKTHWDTERDAQEFYQSFLSSLQQRFPSFDPGKKSASAITLQREAGRNVIFAKVE